MIKIKAIKNQKGNLVAESVPENYNGSFCDGEFFYFFESKQEQKDFLESLPQLEIVEIKSREVAAWKIRAILKSMGLLENINSAISTLEEPTRSIAETAWEYAPSIDQYSHTTLLIQAACQLTDEQVSEIFTAAENLKV